MRELWKCWACGYEWFSRSNTGPKQCPQCRSYYTLPASEYRAILDDVKARMQPGEIATVTWLRTLAAILRERGLKFRPFETLTLAAAILEDLRREGWL